MLLTAENNCSLVITKPIDLKFSAILPETHTFQKLELVAYFCNPAIGGLGQSGFTWTVCHGSSSELRISVRIMLYDVATIHEWAW